MRRSGVDFWGEPRQSRLYRKSRNLAVIFWDAAKFLERRQNFYKIFKISYNFRKCRNFAVWTDDVQFRNQAPTFSSRILIISCLLIFKGKCICFASCMCKWSKIFGVVLRVYPQLFWARRKFSFVFWDFFFGVCFIAASRAARKFFFIFSRKSCVCDFRDFRSFESLAFLKAFLK